MFSEGRLSGGAEKYTVVDFLGSDLCGPMNLIVKYGGLTI